MVQLGLDLALANGRAAVARSFPGRTFDEDRDGARLTKAEAAIVATSCDWTWRTLNQIADLAGLNRNSKIDSRLRCLRQKPGRPFVVESRYGTGGVWEYRLMRRSEP